eukprot:6188215-Pleurochrysis_carterae.AAC.2
MQACGEKTTRRTQRQKSSTTHRQQTERNELRVGPPQDSILAMLLRSTRKNDSDQSPPPGPRHRAAGSESSRAVLVRERASALASGSRCSISRTAFSTSLASRSRASPQEAQTGRARPHPCSHNGTSANCGYRTLVTDERRPNRKKKKKGREKDAFCTKETPFPAHPFLD